MSDTTQARSIAERVHDLDAEMMAALEDSGGELTPEVEAIEARLMKDADALGLFGAQAHEHAEAMLENVISRERNRLDECARYYKRLLGLAKRWCRIAAQAKGVSRFEAGTFRVSLSKPRVKLVGGPRTRSDGWVSASEVDDETFAELSSMSADPKALASLGWKPDRKAILAEIKQGGEVLDYAAKRPEEKTVTVK